MRLFHESFVLQNSDSPKDAFNAEAAGKTSEDTSKSNQPDEQKSTESEPPSKGDKQESTGQAKEPEVTSCFLETSRCRLTF